MGDQETWVKLKTKSYFINVELNDEERCFLSCHKHGTKKKFWVPMRNWTSDLQIPHCDALPLSQNQSRKSESLRFDCCDITMVMWCLSDLCSDALPLSWNWSAGSEGPSFNSSWGLRIFSLSTFMTRQKTSSSIFSPSSKLTISLILFTSWMILAFWLVLSYDLLETNA